MVEFTTLASGMRIVIQGLAEYIIADAMHTYASATKGIGSRGGLRQVPHIEVVQPWL